MFHVASGDSSALSMEKVFTMGWNIFCLVLNVHILAICSFSSWQKNVFYPPSQLFAIHTITAVKRKTLNLLTFLKKWLRFWIFSRILQMNILISFCPTPNDGFSIVQHLFQRPSKACQTTIWPGTQPIFTIQRSKDYPNWLPLSWTSHHSDYYHYRCHHY